MSESRRDRVHTHELHLGADRRTERFIARETPGNVGVALSGGGSRACVAGLGQLRALRELGLLEKVRAISGVSGGTWLSAAWTFLPDDRDDEGFFGRVLAPEALVRRAGPGQDKTCSIDHVDEASFARAICDGSFNAPGLLASGHRAKLRGVEIEDRWAHAVGEILFAPVDLYHVDEEGLPAAFFAADAEAAAEVKRLNPALASMRALTVHTREGDTPRPFAIFNTAFVCTDRDGMSVSVPVQGTPYFVGTPSTPPAVDSRGESVGGGAVLPFSYGGRLVRADAGDPRPVVLDLERIYALHDLVGCSSAFFADKAIGGAPTQPLVPQHPRYRPGVAAPAGGPDYFLDGGALENTGVAALLAWSDIDRVIAFVNAPAALDVAADGVAIVERQVPPLFGYRPFVRGLGYRAYAGVEAPTIASGTAFERGLIGGLPDKRDAVAEGFRNNAVFAAEAFPELLDGLLRRASAGGEAPGVGPSAFLQRGVPVIDNPWHGVTGGRRVDVLWVLLSPASQWLDRLRREVARARPSSWPNYPTAWTHLDPESVNLLSHFTSWVVGELREELDELFEG